MTVNLASLMAIAHSLFFSLFFFCALVRQKPTEPATKTFTDDTDTLMHTASNIYTIRSANFFTIFFFFIRFTFWSLLGRRLPFCSTWDHARLSRCNKKFMMPDWKRSNFALKIKSIQRFNVCAGVKCKTSYLTMLYWHILPLIKFDHSIHICPVFDLKSRNSIRRTSFYQSEMSHIYNHRRRATWLNCMKATKDV